MNNFAGSSCFQTASELWTANFSNNGLPRTQKEKMEADHPTNNQALRCGQEKREVWTGVMMGVKKISPRLAAVHPISLSRNLTDLKYRTSQI